MPKVEFEYEDVVTKTGKTVRLCYCNFCHNSWTKEEGFNEKTGQCAGCQKWDDDKPIRDKEQKEREEFREKCGNINFAYCPGDPFW
jgi:hypothetical protein